MILGKADKDYVKELENKVETLETQLSSKIKEVGKLKLKINTLENVKDTINTQYQELLSKITSMQNKELLTDLNFDKFIAEHNMEYKDLAKYLGISTSLLTLYRRNPDKITIHRYKEIVNKLSNYNTLKG